MYKIVIVDDETMIVESCKLIIEREMGTLFEVYTAFSGEEALLILEKEDIRIVLTDILMPGMTGLDLIRRAHEKNKNPAFILITAYDDFDYAKEAIKLGAIDYILKPINKSILIECLKRVTDILEKEQESRIRILEYQEQHHKILPFIEESLVEMALYSTGKTTEITYCSSILDLDLSTGTVVCLHCSDSQSMSKVIRYIKAKEKCAAGKLGSDFTVMLFPRDRTRAEETERTRLAAVFDRTDEAFRKQGVKLVYGIGELWTDTGGIRMSYEQARDSLRMAASSTFSHTVENEFAGLLLQGDPGCLDKFNELYERYYRKYESNTESLKNSLLPLYHVVMESFAETETKEFLRKEEKYLHEIPSSRLLRDYLVSMIGKACEQNRIVYMKNSDQIVDKVAKYVREHYADSLMLEDLTKRFNYSMAYLSHIFHKKRGITLSDYITDIRMEKANELLAGTTLSIQEIAEKTGYSNSNYFSRKYKKVFGVTPTEFAQKQKEKEERGFVR